MLISKSNLTQETLKGETVIITGAGRGIGYETAKALVWLGANVVIAEIDEKNGKNAQENINREFPGDKAFFVRTVVGDEKDVDDLAQAVQKKYGKVDGIINNATVFPMGAVKDVPVESWDFSYRVNLRGPVLLAKKFLPAMIERKHGIFVCVSSSGAAPFMGPYEVFKTAQVELANTIFAEVETTGVYAFTIGPGISKTPGFSDGGGKVAKLMGMSLDQLLELNKNAQITPEAAGVGFALAVAQAKKYNGQEISSIHVLREANIPLSEREEIAEEPKSTQIHQTPNTKPQTDRTVEELYQSVLKTFIEQSSGWKKRNLFERQWVSRDFKKTTGKSIDEIQTTLQTLGNNLKKADKEGVDAVNKMAAYYAHQQEQLKGFEKNPQKLAENLKIIDDWINEAQQLAKVLLT